MHAQVWIFACAHLYAQTTIIMANTIYSVMPIYIRANKMVYRRENPQQPDKENETNLFAKNWRKLSAQAVIGAG